MPSKPDKANGPSNPDEIKLSDDAIMRELAHLNLVIVRRARQEGGSTGPSLALAILASHEEAMAEGLAPRHMSQVELSDAVGMRPQSMGPLLAHLEQDGCIERVACEHDRRANLIVLTDHGRAAAQSARDGQRAFAAKTLSVLTDEEKASLAAAILKLNKSLS